MIDWLGLRERDEVGRLTVDEVSALITIARAGMHSHKTLSFCWICGGKEVFDSFVRPSLYYDHTDDCAVRVLEASE